MTFTRETINVLKAKYPKGTKVRLVRMDDIQAPPVGTLGVVTGVDDACNIHVSWDTGNSLSLIPGEDDFSVEKN